MQSLKNDLKRFDTIISDGYNLQIDRVTEKAVLLVVGRDGEGQLKKRWVPKSTIKNIEKDQLTSEIGNVYRCSQFPYFIARKF